MDPLGLAIDEMDLAIETKQQPSAVR